MKIIALTKYSYEGPSSRYRFYNYKKSFSENSIEMTIKPLFDKSYFNTKYKWHKIVAALTSYIKRLLLLLQLLVFPKKYDLVLLEYELFPYMPAWFEYILTKRGVKYIVDYDDAIFHKYDRHTNALMRSLLGDKIAKVMQYAQSVIVCNSYLGAYASKYNKQVFTMPTVVLLDRYIEKIKEHQKRDDNRFIIGWIGSWTTGVYVLDIVPAMKQFVEKYDNVYFHLVGFDEKLLSKTEREETHISMIEWSEEDEIEDILDFDIGMMPLPNDAWSRGKCGFKLVQYMSCKKPVIASYVGVNCSLIEEGINGLLVHHDEWFEAFEKLYLDEDLRNMMAQNNFNKIEKEYNNKIHAQRYVNLLQSSI